MELSSSINHRKEENFESAIGLNPNISFFYDTLKNLTELLNGGLSIKRKGLKNFSKLFLRETLQDFSESKELVKEALRQNK